MTFRLEDVKFDERGLVPVVAQDSDSGRVLMLAWANREALQQAQRTGKMTYWSRSRGQLWEKGEESGHGQDLVELRADCDGDAVLARVRQHGAACHTGAATCFETEAPLPPEPFAALRELLAVIAERKASPKPDSYTNKLLASPNLARKKVVEEATELVMGSSAGDRRNEVHEAADVLYHLLVLLAADGVPFEDVLRELEARRK